MILLGKMKVYEIAKELNLTSKEVMDIASKLKIEAKSHLSSIDESDAKKIKAYGAKTNKKTTKKEKTTNKNVRIA